MTASNGGNGGDTNGDKDSDLEPRDAEPDTPSTPTTPMVGGSHDLAPSTVTMSGLLNAIDGVSSQVCPISSVLGPSLIDLGGLRSGCD